MTRRKTKTKPLTVAEQDAAFDALLDDSRTQVVLPSLLESKGKGVSGPGIADFMFKAVLEHGLGEGIGADEVLAGLRWRCLRRAGIELLKGREPADEAIDAVVGLMFEHEDPGVVNAVLPEIHRVDAARSIAGRMVDRGMAVAAERRKMAAELRAALRGAAPSQRGRPRTRNDERLRSTTSTGRHPGTSQRTGGRPRRG